MANVLKHKEVTGKILEAAFGVHNSLGCGFLEKVYRNALCLELKLEFESVEKVSFATESTEYTENLFYFSRRDNILYFREFSVFSG